ncbi:hypothetical protein DN412_12150 [Cupriavidus lacunae]|uniref:DUF1302 domain-containing protein n=2 Tax=Cupriavidus lacunae TaxID=2666307 RepID=A0A370NWZ1_9BURK|nr:hypothetical protein DN412_12150 [Cupriavidus lacunae]
MGDMVNRKEGDGCRRMGGSRRLNAGLRIALSGALVMVAVPALSMEFDTGESDVKVRWDNTLRYSLGNRLQNASNSINNAAGFPFDQSNSLFKKGDFFTNRLDWLSELDMRYKEFGARVSTAAWYDASYGSNAAHTNNPSAYVNDRFTSPVTRYYRGPSGEVLDAFVFGRADVGTVPVDVRLGKHAVIWGEGLFGSTNSVAYSQAPSDSNKAVANPGASAKETALPVWQMSAIAQLTDEVSVAGQYTFSWATNRLPEGGTYFGAADTILLGPNVGREGAVNGKGGDIGLSARWRPDWLDQGTIGMYYRNFDEKNPWASQLDTTTGLRRAVYARDVNLYGLSLAKMVGGVSLGSEVSYRTNMPLNSRGQAGPDSYGARGETFHALLNGVKTFGQSPVFSSAALATELAMTSLVKVTDNAAAYRGNGNAAAGCTTTDIVAGCSTRTFWTFGVSFTPTWTQVFPGVDLSMPLFYSINFKGSAPTNSGGFEGAQTVKVGLSAAVYQRHFIDLSFNYYHGKTDPARGLVLGAPYNDKANLMLTYQTSF